MKTCNNGNQIGGELYFSLALAEKYRVAKMLFWQMQGLSAA